MGNNLIGFLNKKNIKGFYYITALRNIPSILKHSILSRNVAIKAGIKFTDISDLNVQERRKQYHNYVPLFSIQKIECFSECRKKIITMWQSWKF